MCEHRPGIRREYNFPREISGRHTIQNNSDAAVRDVHTRQPAERLYAFRAVRPECPAAYTPHRLPASRWHDPAGRGKYRSRDAGRLQGKQTR